MIIYRGKIKDIVFEFAPSQLKKERGVVIFCDGLPSVPKQKQIITSFSEQGFFVVFPRYKGTWESAGEFLRQSPVCDIEEIIALIKKGKITELYEKKEFNIVNKNIYVIGSSFGGTIALCLANNDNVLKIAALSPVVDFKKHNQDGKEEDLIQLGAFIKRAYGQCYRFSEKNWTKMINGDVCNPAQKLDKEKTKKLLIFYDKSDEVIDFKKIENYVLVNKIKAIEIKKIGHLSFSKISDNMLKKIVSWFA